MAEDTQPNEGADAEEPTEATAEPATEAAEATEPATEATEPTQASEPPTESAEAPTEVVAAESVQATAPVEPAEPKKHLKNGVPRWKRALAVVLLVIGFVLVPLSAVSIWSRNQLLNTDRYVSTVSPLADNADIQKVVATNAVDALFSSVDVSSKISGALPKRAKFLGDTIAAQAQGYAVQLTERAPSSAHEPAFLAARAAAIAAIGQDYFTGLSDMPPRLPDLEKFGLLTEHGAPYTYHDPNFDQIPILEAAVGEAVDRLARTHDMTPFAVALKLKGEIEVLAAATSGVDTTAQAHDSLVDQLRNMAQAGMIRGCGIVSETTRRWAVGQARTNTPYQRAIEIQVEHRSAVTAATFSLPYLRLGTEIRLAMPPRREWGFRTYWRDSKNLVFHI